MNLDPAASPATTDPAERLCDLVGDALALPPAGRAAFLKSACAADATLLAEALSLVDHAQGTDAFLERPAYALMAGEGLDDPHAGSLQPGEMLGECRIISLLGEGGMGEVYLAEDTKLERQVAVKLLKRRLDDDTLGRRFRHERKVLAGLNHPNIARLYGGSTTPDGRSYLVMEYVDGERLDKFCDRRGLDVTQRLTLFRKICAAVGYAHQNLVVHRDLKPANIRVTPEGEPKLLDFGIAKLLDPDSTGPVGDPTVTMYGAMTPEYASPEQLKGEAITTASDVYSLGVILYELLCGQRPYQLATRRADELARAICEQEPLRPSVVAGRIAPTTFTATVPPGQVAANREPATRLRRRLEGDLDNIAAKALRKEPARRYVSAAALAEDLRRHGEGLPVTARKDTLAYRTGKFMRRNKVGVAAIALVSVALVGGLVATSVQRDRARLAQAQAERLNGFLQTLLGSANPENGPGRDLKVVQVLDQASGNLDRELAGEPALLAQAHLTIGQCYAGLREEKPSISHLHAALEIDQRLYGDENIITARDKAALGVVLCRVARHYAEAESLLRQALAVERRQPLAGQSELPLLLDYEGRALSALDRPDEAKRMVAEYLSLIRKTDGEQNLTYANGLLQMANLAIARQDYLGAEMPERQAVAIYRRLNSQTPSFAGVLTSFAYELILIGKLGEPEGILREAQQLYQKTVGEQSVAYGMNLGCLGWLHILRGDSLSAEAELRAARTIAQASTVPVGEQDYVGGTVALALAMTRNGKAAEAEPMLRESLELARANHLLGNALPDNISSALGECLLAQQRYAEAEPCLLAGYAGLQKNSAGQPPALVPVVARLHELYTAWNKPDQAARFADNAAIPPAPKP